MGIAEGMTDVEAMELGTKSAALTITKYGCAEANPFRSEVDQLKYPKR